MSRSIEQGAAAGWDGDDIVPVEELVERTAKALIAVAHDQLTGRTRPARIKVVHGLADLMREAGSFKGFAVPVRKLALAAGVSPTTAEKHLKALDELGWISISRSDHWLQANRVTITVDRKAEVSNQARYMAAAYEHGDAAKDAFRWRETNASGLQVYSALKAGHLSVSDLRDMTRLGTQTVKTCLERLGKLGLVEQVDGHWKRGNKVTNERSLRYSRYERDLRSYEKSCELYRSYEPDEEQDAQILKICKVWSYEKAAA